MRSIDGPECPHGHNLFNPNPCPECEKEHAQVSQGYTESFYNRYADYLKEPGVRRVHDLAFRFADQFRALHKVLDLGCGMSQEFFHHGHPSIYKGMDINGTYPAIRGNYRDPDIVKMLYFIMTSNGLEGITSLFSIECTANARDNADLYEMLFLRTPVETIMTSGFYYTDKMTRVIVEEVGGVRSYQTLNQIGDVPSRIYDEMRLTIPCPSRLFGDKVVEVWRFLNRKAK